MGKIKLSEISTRAPKELDKKDIKDKTIKILAELNELQNLLYAESKHAVLVVIQGMDASGKDGLIREVFGVLNPQGVTVKSFKAPTAEELSHDFLWRVHSAAPGKGMIQLLTGRTMRTSSLRVYTNGAMIKPRKKESRPSMILKNYYRSIIIP